MEDPDKRMLASAQEIRAVISTMNLTLNEDLSYQLYNMCKSQLLFKKMSRENRRTKKKKLLKKV